MDETAREQRQRVALRPRNTIEDLRDEAEPYHDLSMGKKDLILQDLAYFTLDTLLSIEHPEKILNYQDPIPTSSKIIWMELVKRPKSIETQ